MLSRLGFLLSLKDDRLTEACEALEKACERGPADGWVTRWNLMNISCRLGELDDANGRLDLIARNTESWSGIAYIALFVPGRAARDSVVSATGGTLTIFIELQRHLIQFERGDETPDGLVAALSDLPGDPQVQKLIGWIGDLTSRELAT